MQFHIYLFRVVRMAPSGPVAHDGPKGSAILSKNKKNAEYRRTGPDRQTHINRIQFGYKSKALSHIPAWDVTLNELLVNSFSPPFRLRGSEAFRNPAPPQ